MSFVNNLYSAFSNQVDLVKEKNHNMAVRSRIRLALLQYEKERDRLYIQIGKQCFEEKGFAEQAPYREQYEQVKKLNARIDKLLAELKAEKTEESEESPAEEAFPEELIPDFTTTGETVEKENNVAVDPTLLDETGVPGE